MVKTLSLKLWRQFLSEHGLECLRSEGGHEVWNRPVNPFLRPVIFSAHDKEIYSMQIKTNLKTMGLTMGDLEAWLGR